VPEPVQDKILDICATGLAPDGIGYVSYNTFPGWHMRGMIRDMMCYHTSRLKDAAPAGRVQQARTLLDFLAKSVCQENSPYGLLLRQELDTLQKHPDSYLFHEHLEEWNDPIYFFEFHQRLAAKKLRYLGEADLSVMLPGSFPADVQQALGQLAPNLIQMEQYLDFLRNRTFRQTLLCHADREPCYNLSPEQMAAFHLASPLKPVSARLDLYSTAPEQFETPSKLGINTPDPIVKAALCVLSDAWPRAIAFDEVRRQARLRVNSKRPDDPAVAAQDALALGRAVLTAYAGGSNSLMELWLTPPRFTTEISHRPSASPLARLQAVSGPQVTNRRHQTLGVSEFDRQLLPLLDGTRDRAELRNSLVQNFKKGKLSLSREGKPITDPGLARDLLTQTLDQQVPKLAAAALLVG
jgi:methyltransferase-like protein